MGTQTFSFIVKIWIEERVDRTTSPTWHGLVTHVPGHEERYVKNLGEITAFMASHLEWSGVRVTRLTRFGQWLMR